MWGGELGADGFARVGEGDGVVGVGGLVGEMAGAVGAAEGGFGEGDPCIVGFEEGGEDPAGAESGGSADGDFFLIELFIGGVGGLPAGLGDLHGLKPRFGVGKEVEGGEFGSDGVEGGG